MIYAREHEVMMKKPAYKAFYGYFLMAGEEGI